MQYNIDKNNLHVCPETVAVFTAITKYTSGFTLYFDYKKI